MDTSTGAVLTATTGFNVKTKCTWQLTAQTGKAPQFELTSASQTSFFIQWIDNTDEAVTDNTYLPDTLDAQLGKYNDGKYFNPFKSGLKTDFTTLGDGATAGANTLHNQPYNEFAPTTTFTNTLDASIGNVNYWIQDGDSALLGAENVDFNLFAIAEGVMTAVYAEYSDKVDDYNKLAEAYNDKYQAALKDNTVEVPGIPCPPTLPSNAVELKFESDKSKISTTLQQDALNTDMDKDTIYYVPLDVVGVDAPAKAKYDARRLGNLYTNAVAPTDFSSPAAEYDATAWAVGHVYGRLGQGEKNMPGESDAWRYDSDDSALPIMNVSIFPEQGFGSDAFGAEDKIEITATEASFTTEPYAAAKSTAAEAVTTVNAVAMGLSVAALAVSASLF